ncbi:MAG: hypothetical protein HRU15_15945 [Planctomycetes bacterium]|nr:hypothetical protein [Planctomycetota bacterium]
MNLNKSPLSPTPPSDDQKSQENYVHSNHHGSDQMSSLLNETLEQYPAHYQASLGILKGLTSGQRGWRCTGAMETALTEQGMEVAFDYRREEATYSWRRYLVVITMHDGEVTYRNFTELREGQHSGIRAFEGQV